MEHRHDHSDPQHPDHHSQHGHEHDQGLKGAVRYLRFAREMWRSEINRAVLGLVAPGPGETLVDIGAGMGAGTVPAARSGATVVAVEPTPFLRTVLRLRRLWQRNRKRISVVDATAEQLPVGDRSVAAIMAVNTMHHWVDIDRGLAEVARALRPGGRVVLVDEDFDDPTHPDHERFRGGDQQDGHEGGHDHGFSMVDAERVGRLLQAAGLVEVEAGGRRLSDRPVLAITARAPH